MKGMGRRFTGVLVALTLVFGALPLSAGAASAKVTVTLDGTKVAFDTAPKTVDGRTMVPYKALADKVGAKVAWDESSKRVTMTKGDKQVALTVGSKKAIAGKETIELDAAPVLENGRVLVPLRFVGESLGIWVSWNGATSTAALETQKSIKHALGTTVLKSVPERVVVLFNGAVDISVTLGVQPVGAVESYVEQPFYYYLRSEMIGTKVLGDETQPNLEAIVGLKPDVIIASKLRHEKINEQLSAIAPTIMTEDVYSWQENLQMMATVYNKEEAGRKFLADWDRQVADFKKKIGSRAGQTDVSLIRFNPNGTSRAYLTGFAYNIMKDLGFSFPKQQVDTGEEIITLATVEQAPTLDADYIFDFTTDWVGDGGVYKHQSEWSDNPLWENLTAVKNKKYYKVNVVTWNMSGGAMAAKMMLDDLYFYFDLE
ncbi:stalk domain-containing protein [Paenibacillus sp. TRM 82003]|nr:stalk domain-containing protein [Paenibacillus sp. TRM 82003]